MTETYSEKRMASFIESLSDESLLPQWTTAREGPGRVHSNEQGEHSAPTGQFAEEQHNADEPWDNPDYFRPPVGAQECLAVTISSKSLRLLLRAMGKHEWTNEGIRWEETFLGGDDEDKKLWYRIHSKKMKTEGCRKLLMFSHKLWLLCHEAPSAHDIDKQVSYLGRPEHVRKFRQLIHAIHTMVDKVCANAHDDLFKRPEERGHAANTAGSLRRQIIPLLLLALKAAFMMGSQENTTDGARTLPDEGRFTTSVMEVMRQITDWIKKLHLAMVIELEANLPISENVEVITRRPESCEASKMLDRLKEPTKHRTDFAKSLAEAFVEVEEAASRPKRKREAMEKDECILQKREDKKRMEEEAAERRMALFRSSAQAASIGRSIQATPDSSAHTLRESGGHTKHPHPRFHPQMSSPPSQPHPGFPRQQQLQPRSQQKWEANEDEFTQVSTSQGPSQAIPSSSANRYRKRGSKVSYWEKEHRLVAGDQQSQNLLSNEVDQHKCWSYEESNILLTIIRKAPQPSLVDLAGKLPGRSEQDIMKKICELKEMSRRRYEEWDMVPPQWCFA